MATIWWGDGASSVGYVEGGAYSYVSGSHAYAAAGEYAVTASVTDVTDGQTITTTGWVDATPAAVLGYGGTLAATVGQATSSTTPLAMFTGSASLAASAVVDWGDGTTASGAAVQQIGYGMAEVLGSHTYASAGVYAVKTLVYDAAGVLLGAMVSQVAVDGPKSVDGPAVVPGNSQYSYFFNVTPMDANKLSAYTINDSTVGNKWTVEPVPQAGGIIGFDVTAQFANTPAQGDLRLEYTPTGQTKATEVDFPVTVVQVIVKNTLKPFDPNESFKDKNANGKGYKGDLASTGNVLLAIDPPAAAQPGTVQSIGNNPNTPALTWQAEVTLVGPGPKKDRGVSDIQVGFHQVASVVEMTSVFPNSRVKSSIRHQHFLDVEHLRENDRPWYALDLMPPKGPPTYLNGSVYQANIGAGNPTVIGASDNPLAAAITVYDKNGQVAARVEYDILFTLSVAAATTQKPYDGYLFREADADWSWDASGAIAQAGADAQGNILTSWTPGVTAGVNAPGQAGWNVNIPRPVLLQTDGPLFNQVLDLKQETFTTK